MLLSLASCAPPAAVAVEPARVPEPARLESLPWATRLERERALTATDPRYAPRLDEAGAVFTSPSDPARTIASFTHEGARIALGPQQTTVAGAAMGRGASMHAMTAVTASISGPEVRFARDGVIEWWRSLPSGLEHGYTIAERPQGDGALVMETSFAGVRARAASPGTIELLAPSGDLLASYTSLVVTDATGATVSAHFSARGSIVRIEVDDVAAQYPLLVDPLLIVALEYTAIGAISGEAGFGSSVSISGDGSIALVGAPGSGSAAQNFPGRVHVLERSGTSWTDAYWLSAFDAASSDGFGSSVRISSDGTRAIIGVYRDDVGGVVDAGSARIFLRGASGWTEEATLRAPAPTASSFFGSSIGISAAGTYAIAGEPSATPPAAHIFLRSGTIWSRQTTFTAAMAGDSLGDAVAIAGDGSRVLVSSTASGQARVSVYVRSGTSWTHETDLVDPGGSTYFGGSVALASDGSRAAATDSSLGRLVVFLRTGTTWTREATLMDAVLPSFYGVSMSGDGLRLVVGARNTSTVTDGVDFYLRNGTSWSLANTISNAALIGTTTAQTSDGSRAIVNVPFNPGNSGTARIYTVVPGAPNGTACTTGASCATNFCVDGVCCDSACGSGATDCQACSSALTGGTAGICAPLSSANAAMVVCRPSAGDMCDPAETCASTSTVCPVDVRAPPTQVCRASTMGCDEPEYCNGSPSCPADIVWPSGHVCRASAGACDQAEVCDGSSRTCPGDAFLPNNSPCGGGGTPCTSPGVCNGMSATCPGATNLAAGTVCSPSTSVCDAPDTCDGMGVCVPQYAPATTACGSVASGACDAQDHCSGTSTQCVSAVAPYGQVCRPSAGTCDVVETCNGVSPSCPNDTLLVAGAICRGAMGPCDVSEICDGMTAACPTDLRADTSVICRASIGTCDRIERCDGFSPGCPADQIAPPGAVCRPAVPGGCDLAETCDGIGVDCPGDLVEASGTTCRAAAGGCDVIEMCDGTAPTCPANVVTVAGTICRATMGACDPSEACDGTSTACPADVRLPSGTACGGTMIGSCSTRGTCDGANAACPGATPRPAGTVCMPADPAMPCDVDDVCDGTTDVCRATYAPATTACGSTTLNGVCDAPDHCAGSTAACVDAFVSGVVCRAAAGACDTAETCSGTAASCPPDGVESSGMVCRASTASCDPAESCDGASSTCPPDVTTCTTMPDMGANDAGAHDAGSANDAGSDAARTGDASSTMNDAATSGLDAGATPPPMTGACGCRVGRAPSSVLGWLTLALVLARRRARPRLAPRRSA